LSSGEGTKASVRVGLKRVALAELVDEDDVLSQAGLLSGVPREASLSFLAAGVVKRYGDGASLMREAEPSTALVLILRGEARLVARHGAGLVELGIAHKGDVLGEGEALGSERRAYSGVAVGEVDVVEFDSEALSGLMTAHGSVRPYLAALRDRRKAALSEMGAFLGRW
jgi:CRP-like cAMP-binding protein